MRVIKLNKNPYLLFSPFLLFYIVLVLIFPTYGITGDENRYLMYGNNLLHGFYSPASHIDIGDGPGYPILLMPFLALRLPLICITLFNAVLYYLSVVLLFKSLKKMIPFRLALVSCLFWACYYNSFEYIPLVLPEIFTAFLITLLAFLIIKIFTTENITNPKKYIYMAGFVIGYIALTKVIFGYVLSCMLALGFIFWIMKRKNQNLRRTVVILSIGLLTTIPYLIYTYALTNKVFYWSTFGGINLYWMSTPYEGEYGSFVQYPINREFNDRIIPGGKEAIILNHGKELQEIFKNTGSERDDVYKEIAVKNIKSHPLKFLQNCISNVGRMLFNYPYSYTYQKNTTLFRLPLNGILVVLMIFCIIPTFLNWHKIIFPMRFLLFFALFYLGGSIFGSAETRMFIVIVPIIIFWIALIFQKTIRLNLTNW